MLSFGLFQDLSSTIFVPIDSTTLVRIELSKNFQNRIAVDCGRVNQVVHPGCDIDINLDEEIGQVFVYPLTNYPQPTSLTIITDQGEVQDIELRFVDKPSEIVILQTGYDNFEEECCEPVMIGPGDPDYMVMVVRGILENRVPEGFVACDAPNTCRKIKSGARATLVSKLLSGEEVVYIWRIENTIKRQILLSEKDLCFQKGSWVYLHKHCIPKAGHTFAIIGVKSR